MLDAGKLATFRAVAELGSLSAAARARSLTQPAVSRQVALLEAQLGTALLDRSRRGVRPTEAGRLLAAHAAEIERRLLRAEDEVAALAGCVGGRVRLGSFFTAFAQLTPEVSARAERALPDVTLEHVLSSRAASFAGILRGELDAAVVYAMPGEPPDPAPAGIEVLPLWSDPARVLLPAAHPLAARRELRIGDLAGATWVRAHDGTTADVLDRVVRPRDVLLAGRGDEPVEGPVYVASGAGVMLAWALNVLLDPERVAVRPLVDAPPRRIEAALPARPSAAARAVAGLLAGLRP